LIQRLELQHRQLPARGPSWPVGPAELVVVSRGRLLARAGVETALCGRKSKLSTADASVAKQKGLSMDGIFAAAKLIAAARRDRTALDSLPADIAPVDEAAGYRIQDAVHALLTPDFGPLVGHKIGCTSVVMQQYLQIPHPCAGGVFEKGVHRSGAVLRHGDFVRVGVECEIAVRLSRDLAPSRAPFIADNVAPAVEAYLPSIEIVDDRYVDWQGIGGPTLVADDFFAAGWVFGEAVGRSRAPDLLTLRGRALVNGAEVAHGTGADVLGDPLNALAWLANHLAASGKGLRAGEIVLTGSLVKTLWLDAGDRVTMDLSELGTVTAEFRG
jgi:2-keto-4-pentenoate hydratase